MGTSLTELLDGVPKTLPSIPGRPLKVRNSLTLSALIRKAIIDFGYYDIEDLVAHVLYEAGITLSRDTLKRIAKEH